MFAFVPYLKNVSTLPEGAFVLKSDEDNANAAQNFINVCVTVAVVVALTTAGVCLARSIRKKAYFKRLSTVSTLQKKLNDGQVS